VSVNCQKIAARGVYIVRGALRNSLAVTIHAVKSSSHTTQADFEAVFTSHWSRVYGLLFRLVGEHAEAEDLALEVFWRYYQRPPAEQDPRKLGGWLYRVALRLGYNALRAQRRRQHYEESAGRLELLEIHRLDAEGQFEQAERCQQVRRVLAKMKPRAAQILILRYAGCSYAEIASTLEVAPGSVGTMLNRAEAEFQKRFEQVERGR
jgi:RNA polymerase sigma-70 factor (ECF subfamily)